MMELSHPHIMACCLIKHRDNFTLLYVLPGNLSSQWTADGVRGEGVVKDGAVS
jgi:hypothetical protein